MAHRHQDRMRLFKWSVPDFSADQALTPQELKNLMGVLGAIATAVVRTL